MVVLSTPYAKTISFPDPPSPTASENQDFVVTISAIQVCIVTTHEDIVSSPAGQCGVDFSEKVISTSAFKVAGSKPNQHISLIRSGYFGILIRDQDV